MKDVFGKTPVKFFYDRVHLNTLVYNEYERCEPFPEKNGFPRLGWRQNWVLTIHTAPINGKIALETNY